MKCQKKRDEKDLQLKMESDSKTKKNYYRRKNATGEKLLCERSRDVSPERFPITTSRY